MVAVRDAMKRCTHLEEIRFTWIHVGIWIPTPDLIGLYDSMLKIFGDVRGVGKVIFTEELSVKEQPRMEKWLDPWGVVQLASQDIRDFVKASMESPRT